MSNNSSSSINFAGVLAIVFITLKLTGNIDWPWVWVLSPIWIPIAIALFLLVLWFVVEYFRK